MTLIAFLFPGQGAQAVGMGKDLAEFSPEAKQVFETFNRHVHPDLTRICFEGPEETLRQTQFTQPGLLAAELAALAAFQARCNVQPAFAAGHSLGEYAALFAAGVVDLDTVAQLVKKRAELMATAPEGAMAAVLGLAETQVEKAVLRVRHQDFGAITIANYNTGDQYVISGSKQAVEATIPVLKEEGAKRVIPLEVSGAFHSPLMHDASVQFGQFVGGFNWQAARFPVVTNVDAQVTTDGFAEKLADQIEQPVRWSAILSRLMTEEGVDTVIEFGPGRVLTNMVKKLYPAVTRYNVSDVASLEETVSGLKQVMSVC
jgi:[acyl-carrier-protein] S-malonyltransferase